MKSRQEKARAVALLSLLLIAATPSPTHRNDQQAQPREYHNDTQNVPTPPAPFVTSTPCEPRPTPKGQNSSDNSQSWNDWFWETLPNWVLAGLALWAGLAAYGTLSEMRRQAKKQADDFDKSFAEIREATKAATRQAKVGEATLILTQRPRLIVRNVVVKRWENVVPQPGPLFERGMPIHGQLYISNVGGTPARIVEVGCWVEWVQGPLPMERPYETKNPYELSHPIELQPSQSTPWPFSSEEVMDTQTASLVTLNSNNWSIYVLGWIGYKDNAGIKRRTAFCRCWNFTKQRFLAVDDPDYEHEE